MTSDRGRQPGRGIKEWGTPPEQTDQFGRVTLNKDTDDPESLTGVVQRPVVDPRFFESEQHDVTHYTPQPHFRRGEGGQGRLFAEQNWVRGYSPNRQARINEAMATRGGRLGDKPEPVDIDVSQIKGYGRRTINARSAAGKRERGLVQESYKRELTEQLKRSTIPPEHLQSVSFQLDPTGGHRGGEYQWGKVRVEAGEVRKKIPKTSGEARAEFDEEGTFKGPGRFNPYRYESRPTISNPTLIHEMGHHVDLGGLLGKHSPSITGAPMMRPEEDALREVQIRKNLRSEVKHRKERAKFAKEQYPEDTALHAKFDTSKEWQDKYVAEEQERFRGHSPGPMWSTRIGLNEAAADIYGQVQRRPGTSLQGIHGYGPHGIQMNVNASYDTYSIGSAKQHTELAQQAYLKQHERFGMTPKNSRWGELMQRGTTEPEHEQMGFF